ncbi:MAG: hypothetical protein AAFV88_04215 [Planctomycetota bacterium]
MEDKVGVAVQERKQRRVGSRVRVGKGHECESQPEVRVQRNGDRIESIVIACSCGEEITVICGYEETPNA